MPRPARIVLSLFGTVVTSGCIVVLYLGMLSVMAVGGTCASGGPYEIAVECPQAVAWLMPASIFIGMAGAAVAVWGAPAALRPFAVVFWSALFGLLGWGFMQAGLPSGEQSFGATGIFLGLMFWLMAAFPLYFVIRYAVNGTAIFEADASATGRLTSHYYVEVVEPRVRTDAFPSDDVSVALARLAELHRAGDLSTEEFTQAKQRLLNEG